MPERRKPKADFDKFKGLRPTARMRTDGGIEGEGMLGAMFNGLFEPVRRDDIELPNESGQVDPRLPRTGDALKHAMKVFRDINDRAAERKRK